MQAVKNVKKSTLANFIRDYALPGAEIHTDEYPAYLWLDASEFVHNSVNHKETYVKAGNIHVNALKMCGLFSRERLPAFFIRFSASIYHCISIEFAFRLNNRNAPASWMRS